MNNNEKVMQNCSALLLKDIVSLNLKVFILAKSSKFNQTLMNLRLRIPVKVIFNLIICNLKDFKDYASVVQMLKKFM